MANKIFGLIDRRNAIRTCYGLNPSAAQTLVEKLTREGVELIFVAKRSCGEKGASRVVHRNSADSFRCSSFFGDF